MLKHVTAQTARNDLTDLHVRGFLVKNQIGKEFVFAPIGDLYAKLHDGASVRDGASRRITARRRR
jgi:hypothetical protein